jgi:hypothetical protein
MKKQEENEGTEEIEEERGMRLQEDRNKQTTKEADDRKRDR